MDWLRVTLNNAEYDVSLQDHGNHVVQVIKMRRDTGTIYNQTIKPRSQNWRAAVRRARAKLNTLGSN